MKSWLSDEDIVYKEALNIVSDLICTERCLLFFIIWWKMYYNRDIRFEDFLSSSFVLDVYEKTPNHDRRWFLEESNNKYYSSRDFIPSTLTFRERISRDLEFLIDNFINYNENNTYDISLKRISAIVILMLDADIRYGYVEKELLEYMMDLFGELEENEV